MTKPIRAALIILILFSLGVFIYTRKIASDTADRNNLAELDQLKARKEELANSYINLSNEISRLNITLAEQDSKISAMKSELAKITDGKNASTSKSTTTVKPATTTTIPKTTTTTRPVTRAS